MAANAFTQRLDREYILGKGNKLPSPCIDVCTYKHDVCVGCGRTKKQKKAWKDADTNRERKALILECAEAAQALGIYDFWAAEYRRKCRKKGRTCLLDEVAGEAVEG